MLPELKGKGIFVFSDPGGAKPILAIVKKVQGSLEDYKVISDRQYSFYEEFGVIVDKNSDPAELIQIFRPDFIFTGTSYTSDIDWQFIRAARAANILVYSLIDHWTSLRQRFIHHDIEVLPNFILVIDEHAKQLAIKEGLPEKSLYISGNPYHEYLISWKPMLSKEKFLLAMGYHTSNKKILLYAPDPLSNINGKEVFGFDELEITLELQSAFSEISEEWEIWLNPHPNQNLERLQSIVSDCVKVIPEGTSVNSLISYSDVVVGFFSSLLIEAELMGKRVYRVLPSTLIKGKDPLMHRMTGTVISPNKFIEHILEYNNA